MNALDELRTPSPEPISNAATDTCWSRNDESDRLRSAGKHRTEPALCAQAAAAVRQEEGLIALRYTEGGGDARLQMLDLVSRFQRDVAKLLPRYGSDSHVDRQPVLLFDASVLIQMPKRDAGQLRIAIHHCCAAEEEEGDRAARAAV